VGGLGEKVDGQRDTCTEIQLGGQPHMRVGTLIVATIYLQLIQNRYMF